MATRAAKTEAQRKRIETKTHQLYREWRAWATREIADTIIRHGFAELGALADRIVVANINMQEEVRKLKEE